jgi:hypothetical protein
VSPPLPINRLAIAIFGFWLLVTGARADDIVSGNGTFQSVPLDVAITKGEVIGTEQVQRAFITAGTNQFMIVAPGDARVHSPTSDRVTFIPSDYHYYLSFRLLTIPEGMSDSLSGDFYRGQLLNGYPGAKITTEESAMAASHQGQSFELLWTSPKGTDEIVRVAYVPCWAGMLEFSMVVDAKNADEARGDFRGLLMTCRSNENGKIQVVAYPTGD